jgi:hypothetical protein
VRFPGPCGIAGRGIRNFDFWIGCLVLGVVGSGTFTDCDCDDEGESR